MYVYIVLFIARAILLLGSVVNGVYCNLSKPVWLI